MRSGEKRTNSSVSIHQKYRVGRSAAGSYFCPVLMLNHRTAKAKAGDMNIQGILSSIHRMMDLSRLLHQTKTHNYPQCLLKARWPFVSVLMNNDVIMCSSIQHKAWFMPHYCHSALCCFLLAASGDCWLNRLTGRDKQNKPHVWALAAQALPSVSKCTGKST